MSEEINNDDKDFEDAFNEFASADKADGGEQFIDNDEDEDSGLDNNSGDTGDNELDGDADNDVTSSNDDVNEEETELERLRREKEELEHYKKSNEGRVSALQQKINDLMEQRIEAAQSQSQEQHGNSDATDDLSDDDDEWNLLKEEDEFLAEQLEKRLQKERELIRREMMQELESKLQPIEQDREQAYINAQINVLSEKVPDWENIVQSDEFAQWIESQPVPVQSLVQSVNADDYLYLINSYKSMNETVVNPSQSVQADEIKRKRQEKLQSNVAVKRRNAGRVSGPPDDFEGAFEYFAKQDAIKKSRGY